MADLTIDIGAKDQASEKFRNVGKAAGETGRQLKQAGEEGKKGGESIAGGVLKAQFAMEALKKATELAVDFLKDGFKGIMEAEQADRRLGAALKQLGYDTDALLPKLKAQADAFEASTLVQAEQVQQIQELLLRYGVAPRDIQRTTQAILDYSAATGKDAVNSAQTLMRATKGEGEQMEAFGVAVKRTGDNTKDLNSIVDQMSQQFGGAAASSTQGLAGDLGKLKIQQEKLAEAFANWITDVDRKYHIIEHLTVALEGARLALFGDDEEMKAAKARMEEYNRQLEIQGKIAQTIKELRKELAATPEGEKGFGGHTRRQEIEREIKEQEELLAKYKGDIAKQREELNRGLTEGASGTARTITDGFHRATDATDEGGKKLLAAMKKIADQVQKERDETDEMLREYRMAAIQDEEAATKRRVDAMMKSRDREDAEWQKLMGNTRNRLGQLSVGVAQDMKDQGEPAMQQAGIAIGSAFLDGLDSQIEQLQSGGEMDMGQLIASLIPLAVQFALLAADVPEPVAALGGKLAGVAVKAGMREVDKGSHSRKPKFHSGGWVDGPPRYHSGSWALGSDEEVAILQSGERVLSRREVHAMGGPRAVDGAARGTGATFYVSTLDAQSFTDFMGTKGGSGLTRALRENRGELPGQLKKIARKAGR